MGDLTRSGTRPKACLPVLSLLFLPASFLGAATAPVVDSLSATPSTVAPGGTVAIAVAAHDPDCTSGTCTTGCGQYVRADLTAWSADGGAITGFDNGVSASPYAATATWQAPTVEGGYIVTVRLSDSGTSLCGGRLSTVANLPIQVTTLVNEPPVVRSLKVEPVPAFPGEPVRLSCDAFDPEGTPLTFEWSADAGTLTPGDPGSATLVATEPGAVTVTCTVTDAAGGVASATALASISAARSERTLAGPFVTPQRVAIDSRGWAWVADRGAGGLVGLPLADGSVDALRRIPFPGIRAVAADWEDRLFVGGSYGPALLAPGGGVLLKLDPGEPLGEVTDVAVDLDQRRYLALYRAAARVVVFAQTGEPLFSFGTLGDGTEDLRSPSGLAVGPGGSIAVADAGHGRIQRFTRGGVFLYGFGQLGGGLGRFVQLDAVAYDGDGILYASDSFQSWVQSFYPDGRPREAIGTYGTRQGQFRTPAGVAVINGTGALVVASLNGSSLEVFRLEPAPGVPPPQAVFVPSRLELPAAAIAAPSAPKSARLANLGARALPVGRLVVRGDFALVHDCPTALAPGAACELHVTAVPRSEGELAGWIGIEAAAGGAPARLALAGRGLPGPGPGGLEPPAADGEPQLRIGDVELAEGDGEPREAVFPVTLSASPEAGVTVDFETRAGTASVGEDFEPRSGRLAMVPGQQRAEIRIPVRGDRFLEDERETFTVDLTAVRGAAIARSRAIGTILDDESCPGPDLLGSLAAASGAGWTERGAWRAAAGPAGTDAGSSAGRARIATGRAAAESSLKVDLTPWAEWIATGRQLLRLGGLVRAAGARSGEVVLEFLDAGGEVLDGWSWLSAAGPAWQPIEGEVAVPVDAVAARVRLSAPPADGAGAETEFAAIELRTLRTQTLWLEPPAAPEGDFGATEAAFVAHLACADRRPVAASVASGTGSATPGADFLPFASRLTFAPGETGIVLAVTVFGDQADEGDEEIALDLESLGAVSCALPAPTVRLRILDDDRPANDSATTPGGPR